MGEEENNRCALLSTLGESEAVDSLLVLELLDNDSDRTGLGLEIVEPSVGLSEEPLEVAGESDLRLEESWDVNSSPVWDLLEDEACGPDLGLEPLEPLEPLVRLSQE